jgi:membrane-bound lytic murein transglycosylase MltF
MRAAFFTGFLALLASFACAGQAPAADTAPSKPRQLAIANKPWTGDFDRMLARRKMIRVLVPYSRTLYYTDRGRERGLTAELVRDFEQHVNRKYKTGKRPVTFYLMPTTRDKLLPQLAAGLGDIAAGNLTVTNERLKLVEPNIHAGAKYMDILMTKDFPDAHFSEGNRPLFAFAGYNAGAGNIARMRREAARRGLNPDKWSTTWRSSWPRKSASRRPRTSATSTSTT